MGADAIRLVSIFCHYTCGLSWFLYKKPSTESFAKWKGEPRTFKSKKHPNWNHWKFPFARIYKYNVNPTPFPSILSNKRKTVIFFSFSFENIWMVWEKPIPLHPLLRTNAVTKQLLSQKGQTKERVLWKDYNKQRSSSTRSRLLFHLILYRGYGERSSG